MNSNFPSRRPSRNGSPKVTRPSGKRHVTPLCDRKATAPDTCHWTPVVKATTMHALFTIVTGKRIPPVD